MTNDEKIKQYKKQKRDKWLLIGMSLAVIVLEILALLNIISMLWGLGLFIIIYLFKKNLLK